MIKKINHIGIIVPNVEEGINLFRDGIGMEFLRMENLPDWKCKIAFFQCGEVMIELVEPTDESDGMTFLKERGGGIHHIAYEVDDINEEFSNAKKNFAVKTDSPVSGAGDSKVFFLDEKKILNVVTEYVEVKNRRGL